MRKSCGHHLPCNCNRDASDFTDKIKEQIERCIEKNMSLEETMAYLQETHQIDTTTGIDHLLRLDPELQNRLLLNHLANTPSHRSDVSPQSLPLPDSNYPIDIRVPIIADAATTVAQDPSTSRITEEASMGGKMKKPAMKNHRDASETIVNVKDQIERCIEKNMGLEETMAYLQETHQIDTTTAIENLLQLDTELQYRLLLNHLAYTPSHRSDVSPQSLPLPELDLNYPIDLLQFPNDEQPEEHYIPQHHSSDVSPQSLPLPELDLNHPIDQLQFPNDEQPEEHYVPQHHSSDVSPQSLPLPDSNYPIDAATTVAQDPSTSRITSEAPTENITEEASMGGKMKKPAMKKHHRDTSETIFNVKDQMERCIEKNMSLEETMAYLEETHQIDIATAIENILQLDLELQSRLLLNHRASHRSEMSPQSLPLPVFDLNHPIDQLQFPNDVSPQSLPLPDSNYPIETETIVNIKNHIKGCMQIYMSMEETMKSLQNTQQIDPQITKTVWEDIERKNPDIFEVYDLNVQTFNSLLAPYVDLMQEHEEVDLTKLPPAINEFLRLDPAGTRFLQNEVLASATNTPTGNITEEEPTGNTTKEASMDSKMKKPATD